MSQSSFMPYTYIHKLHSFENFATITVFWMKGFQSFDLVAVHFLSLLDFRLVCSGLKKFLDLELQPSNFKFIRFKTPTILLLIYGLSKVSKPVRHQTMWTSTFFMKNNEFNLDELYLCSPLSYKDIQGHSCHFDIFDLA